MSPPPRIAPFATESDSVTSSPRSPRRTRAKRRPLAVQQLEDRRLLAAAPLGASVFDTGEFMLGSVAVVPVLFESDGTIDAETQNWSPGEIDAMLARISEGVNWWSGALDELDTVHSLDFVIDDTYAANPVSTPYEPIDRVSDDFQKYAGGFLEDQGYGDSPSFEAAVHRFNHDQRLRLGTDWAFSIFVADASDDADGQFESGGSFSNAFAFAGGQFIVLPSSRPASTVAHEMGHIFWARDEYPGGGSWTDTRGYYDAQNLNAADDAPPGSVQEISIMRAGEPLAQAYANQVSPASTLAMVGWQDSDGNGIFDLADVPLALDAVGHFDAETDTYHFRGSASAVPLRNQNSSGPQSDITLNQISRLEYSLDGGEWVTAATPDAQGAELDVSVEIPEPFSAIRWRVIDDAVGVTSPVLEGSATSAAISPAAVTGYAFLDDNASGDRDGIESLLADATVTIRGEDGTPLPAGVVEADQLEEGEIGGPVAGVSLSSEGAMLDGRLSVREAPNAGERLVFHAFDQQRERWTAAWSERAVLRAELDQPVGEATVEFAALGDLGYGRVEAYDASGSLVTRATSVGLEETETASVTVSDPHGQIASIRAFGHADTRVAVEAIGYGIPSTSATDASGAWAFPNLADGTYRVDVIPELAIHEFDQASFVIDVVEGASPTVVAAASRVMSPRHNDSLPQDVNGDGVVTALDALLVINDLNRNESRMLTHGERDGPSIDVNDDGAVSALDALLVINTLSRQSPDGDGEGEQVAGGRVAENPDSTADSTVAAPVAGEVQAVAPQDADAVMAGWPAPEPPSPGSPHLLASQTFRLSRSAEGERTGDAAKSPARDEPASDEGARTESAGAENAAAPGRSTSNSGNRNHPDTPSHPGVPVEQADHLDEQLLTEIPELFLSPEL